MGILGNYSVIHKSPGRFMSGAANVVNRASFSKSGMLRNRFYSLANFSAIPNGYVHPYSWSMAQESGGMASYMLINASVSNSSNLAGGINVNAAITGNIEITTASLGLIVQLVAAILGNGSLNAPTIAGVLTGSSSLSASGNLNTPLLGAIQDAVASIIASGAISEAQLQAIASISADILPYTELSPQGLASAVWGTNVENGMNTLESLKIMLSALAGQLSGAGTTTISIRDINNTIDRIVATVDANGNRSSVTLNKE